MWFSVSNAVAPTNRKFHPTPTSVIASQKCITSTPEMAMPTQSTFSATPASMTLNRPKRRMSAPVTNDGANMPTRCH
ncbi:hypothetical protein D3C83_202200 [compost metagenome]